MTVPENGLNPLPFPSMHQSNLSWKLWFVQATITMQSIGEWLITCTIPTKKLVWWVGHRGTWRANGGKDARARDRWQSQKKENEKKAARCTRWYTPVHVIRRKQKYMIPYNQLYVSSACDCQHSHVITLPLSYNIYLTESCLSNLFPTDSYMICEWLAV